LWSWHRSGDGFAVDLPGAAFGASWCGLGWAESEPLVEGPGSAGSGARVVGAEGHHFHDARALDEPADRTVDEGAADALPACLLGDYEPAQVPGRRVCADEQATEQVGLVTGDCDERGRLPDVLGDGCAEAWVSFPRPWMAMRATTSLAIGLGVRLIRPRS
jgi:hypothetical protein